MSNPTVKPYLYVASSWRNEYQPETVERLRQAGFGVYDFRNPDPNDKGFNWRDIDPNWQNWNVSQFSENLCHPLANNGFTRDFEAMHNADAGVLVLPCGMSAHLEAGWLCGKGKEVVIYAPKLKEPELMYKMFNTIDTDGRVPIYDNLDQVIEVLNNFVWELAEARI